MTWVEENEINKNAENIKLNDPLNVEEIANAFFNESNPFNEKKVEELQTAQVENEDEDEDEYSEDDIENNTTIRTVERVPRGSKPPKLTLKEAVEITLKLYEDAGGMVNLDVLSKFTENSPSSSTFKNKLSALKKFNLIEDKADSLTLTDTARLIVAPKTPEEKLINLKTAFLGYRRFEKIYSQFAGKILPQDEFLKNIFAEVVPKSFAKKWMENFKISAEFAGLFSKRQDGRIQVLEGIGEMSDEKKTEEVEEKPDSDKAELTEIAVNTDEPENVQNIETTNAIRKIFLKESKKSILVSTDATMFEIKTGKDMNFVLKLIELFDQYENGEEAKPIQSTSNNAAE